MVPSTRSGILGVVVFAVFSAVLVAISLWSYLLFHGLAEVVSVAVSFSIFMIAWNARPFLSNNYLLLLGIAYLWVGLFDLLHAFAYQGMGVFPGGDANLATQLWIAARIIESASFLAAALFVRRPLSAGWALIVYAFVSALFLAAIFWWQVFPDCYHVGRGLTQFKRAAEGIIAATFAASLLVLVRVRKEIGTPVLRLLAWSIGFKFAAEIAFSVYTSVYGPANLVGHLLKLGSVYLIYQALIGTGLRQPYALLFRDLSRIKEKLLTASLTDELTGLYNRRGFFTVAERHLEIARRLGRTVTLLFADVDGLKRINDSLGHAAGDRALKVAAEVLKGTFRRADLIARFGGDEFAILMLDAGSDEPRDRLRANLDTMSREADWDFEMSISLGSARAEVDETFSLEALMRRADDAMYQDKRQRHGRARLA